MPLADEFITIESEGAAKVQTRIDHRFCLAVLKQDQNFPSEKVHFLDAFGRNLIHLA
jgi:hypothetical protein